MSVPVSHRTALTVVKVVLALVIIAVRAFVGLVAAWVFNPAWDNCVSRVDGRLVEHDCGE